MWLTKGWQFRPRDMPVYTFDRFGTFIDGIFAIAATILIVEVRVPDAPAGQLGRELADLTAEYVVYTLAFTQIVGGWLVGRRIEKLLRGIDHYATLLYLGAIAAYALLPFTVRLITTSLDNAADLEAAVRAAAGVALGSMIFYASFIVYCERRGLIRDDLDPEAVALGTGVSRWAWTLPALSFVIASAAAVPALCVLGVFCILPLLPLEVHRNRG
jgi:TMEM175 potassium channel family protein